MGMEKYQQIKELGVYQVTSQDSRIKFFFFYMQMLVRIVLQQINLVGCTWISTNKMSELRVLCSITCSNCILILMLVMEDYSQQLMTSDGAELEDHHQVVAKGGRSWNQIKINVIKRNWSSNQSIYRC